MPAKTAAIGEVQYPLMAADELAGDATAEYEEDATAEYEEEDEEYAPIVSTEAAENFAPIISAADLPRPGRVRPAASEELTPPDLSLPPVQPRQAAAPQETEPEPAARQPGRLSSLLRLPEFRSRSSKQ